MPWQSDGTFLTDTGKLPVTGTLRVYHDEASPAKWAFEIWIDCLGWECVTTSETRKKLCLARSVVSFTDEKAAQDAAKAEWKRIQEGIQP